MTDEDQYDALVKAVKYVSAVRDALTNNNRYFAEEEFISTMSSVFEDTAITLEKGTILYRARIYKENTKYEDFRDKTRIDKRFQGYDAENSFVNNSSWPQEGRMNPAGIRMLYTSSDDKTCISELQPGFEEIISVARIKCGEPLYIADLSKSFAFGDSTWNTAVSLAVQETISTGYSSKDYVFPQYIAALCKKLGYDGIGFRSKYRSREEARNGKGTNYTIFNYEDCNVVSSRLVKVTQVKHETINMKRSIEDKEPFEAYLRRENVCTESP